MTVSGIYDTGHVVRFYSRPWFRPLIGAILLAAILLAGPVWGRIVSGDKISDEISRDAAVVSVIVDLYPDVSTFHREELSNIGVFSGRDRDNPSDRSRVRLQNVTQEGLRQLARLYWVERIEPA